MLTADSGFSNEAAAAAVLDADIDAYIANPQFRKRDPRFSEQQQHNAKTPAVPLRWTNYKEKHKRSYRLLSHGPVTVLTRCKTLMGAARGTN